MRLLRCFVSDMHVCLHVMRRRMHVLYGEEDTCDSSDALSLTCRCVCVCVDNDKASEVSHVSSSPHNTCILLL